MKVPVFIKRFSTKKGKNMSILVASDPDPVPSVRIRILPKRSGSGSATLELVTRRKNADGIYSVPILQYKRPRS
jgi:hypothetical protein